MPFRIETKLKVPDARSVSKRGFFNSLGLKNQVAKVMIMDAYTIDARLNQKQMQKSAELLSNPLVESYQISSRSTLHAPRLNFDYAIEISFLPGVTDNVGHTAKETLADGTRYKFKEGQNIYSSQIFFIWGKLSKLAIQKIADSLYNPLIQKATVKSLSQFQKDQGFAPNLPKVKLTLSNKVLKIDLNVPEKELKTIAKLGILDPKGFRRGPLALDLEYLIAIRDYFNKLGRKPTDVELESLGQTWSEHCKHIIFNSPIDNIKEGLFKRYIKGATAAIRKQSKIKDKMCVSVFKDNSGAIGFDKDFLITHKVETHNTPSALDPFGGSVTGIVGVNRDCLGFGLSARPVINTYGFCLAPTGTSGSATNDDNTKLYRDKTLTQPMLSARRIMDGVVAGINAGGNQSGIPTNSGFLFFDKNYRGKPLVFAGTVGLIPRKINGRLAHEKQARPNDYIVMVGGRVGLDGIHGATFSSESLDAHSPATAVQIGDPITQKKFSDAIAREARGLFNSITDCGAGGLSSAVGEMAKESGGCEVQLDAVPVKYPGLAPWQIWISESQERMVLAIPPKNWPAFQKLMKRRGVESSVIGKFTNDGRCVVKFKKQVVNDVNLEFLHNGLPKKHLKTKKTKAFRPKRILSLSKEESKGRDAKSTILNLLSSPNIASTSFLSAQYDHEVQGASVLKPLQGIGRVSADATITRPVLTSQKGVSLSSALFPEYSETDPYSMAACAIDSAIRQAVAAGASPDNLALLDNFCWSSPEDPKRLWQLKQAAKACFDYAVGFGAPFISGKDSMYNDFKGFDAQGKPVKISIPPTLLISAIGVINDVKMSISLDAKMAGDIIYLLGQFPNLKKHSNILQNIGISKIDGKKNLSLYRAFYKAAQNDLIASALSIGRGGLAVALCKTAIAGQLGMAIDLSFAQSKISAKGACLPARQGSASGGKNHQSSIHPLLFSEFPGQILATVDPKKAEKFENIFKNLPLIRLGQISRDKTISIKTENSSVKIPLLQATQAYHSTFQNF